MIEKFTVHLRCKALDPLRNIIVQSVPISTNPVVTLPESCHSVILRNVQDMRTEQVFIIAVISTTNHAWVRPHELVAGGHEITIVLQWVHMLCVGEKLASPADSISFPLVAEELTILSRGKIK